MKGQTSLKFLLVLLCALSALSTDIYLSSIPVMAKEWQVPVATVNQSLAWFMLTFAAGQLMFGPLLDKYGRKIPLLFGLVIFCIGSTLCAFAEQVFVLNLGRAISGFGASAGVTAAFAICRDYFKGPDLTNALANIAAAVALAPILAPILGTFIAEFSGWRSVFFTMSVVGLLVVFWTLRVLPRARPLPLGIGIDEEKQGHESTRQIERKNKASVWQDPVFYVCVLANCGGFAALFAFVSTSSAVLIEEFNQSALQFSVWFGLNAVVYMLASKSIGSVRKRCDNAQLLIIGAVLMMTGSVMNWLTLAGFGVVGFLSSMAVITAGLAFISPAANSEVLEEHADKAATVSGLLGSSRLFAGFVAGMILSLMEQPLLTPLSVALLVSSAITLTAALYLLLHQKNISRKAQCTAF